MYYVKCFIPINFELVRRVHAAFAAYTWLVYPAGGLFCVIKRDLIISNDGGNLMVVYLVNLVTIRKSDYADCYMATVDVDTVVVLSLTNKL